MDGKESSKQGLTKYLQEHDAKKLIASYGIPTTREIFVTDLDLALKAAKEIGYPVVLKGAGEAIQHKTELGLVAVGISDADLLKKALDGMLAKKVAGLEGFLVQEMVKGDREFIAGLNRDPQFGPVVLFGLGGIFTEALRDTSFRVAPLTEVDALDMISEIKASSLLSEFRGQPAVDRKALAHILITLGRIGMERDDVQEIDLNPLKISGSKPVAVDALVGLTRPEDAIPKA